ncbi:hypothetical protein [Aquimonas voraii]|uniref:Uncharacterized protein n=1 Tax=Aquimonas voraii TaxID=265719 RepID=A0A1G6RZQ3_9GAMM|nr:hypothetical protein [Aquimonas voraii]SDD09445.1 hypothetical protein SAMN04488509_101172 [Aquimonas voraii]
MTARNLLLVLALLAVVIWGARCSRDPLRTELPFGSTDLSSVEASLARLAPEDRARVEAYVKRSNGDYLPAGMGDPDMPFSARTFAEAIELEKRWEARLAQEAVAQQGRESEREAALAPLRALVSVEILRASIDTRRGGSGSEVGGAKPVGPRIQGGGERMRLSLRVRNRSAQDVVHLAGTLRARDRDSPLGLSLCYFEISAQQPLTAHEVRDFDCVQQRAISEQERAFVAGAPGRFSVEWLPREITLADGRSLKSGVY